MMPFLIPGDDAFQKTMTFSHMLTQQSCYNYILFFCEHPWNLLATNLMIFQCCQQFLQHIEVHVQLFTQFPGYNVLICLLNRFRQTLFHELTAVPGLIKHLYLSPWLKYIYYGLTVITFTIWFI